MLVLHFLFVYVLTYSTHCDALVLADKVNTLFRLYFSL